MAVWYNEIEPFAAQWLENLIERGHLPSGVVDRRSIENVHPDDLKEFTQCHFFAGIGGWPLALRIAGWPDERPVWTGSCPCQSLSSAGQRKGHADKRHLWPAFHRLITVRRPPAIFGEQVTSPDGREWLAGVRADLEGDGYAFGAADLPAAGVGAPHIRQRFFWVAYANRERHEGGEQHSIEKRIGPEPFNSRGLDNAASSRHEPQRSRQSNEQEGRCVLPRVGCKAIVCADGRSRRVPSEPAFQPLAHGVPGRLGQLRAYGNAIRPDLAAKFIEAAEAAEGA